MSEFNGGSEVSTPEVNETPAAETGGEASEATQESAREQANESGGFENDETEKTMDDEDSEEEESENEEGNEIQSVGFEETEDPDHEEGEQDNPGVENNQEDIKDEDRVGFDDEEITDDTEKEDEKVDPTEEKSENEDPDEEPEVEDEDKQENNDKKSENEDPDEEPEVEDEDKQENNDKKSENEDPDEEPEVEEETEDLEEDDYLDEEEDEDPGVMEEYPEDEDSKEKTKETEEDSDKDADEDTEKDGEKEDPIEDENSKDDPNEKPEDTDKKEENIEQDEDLEDEDDDPLDDEDDEDPGEAEDYSSEDSEKTKENTTDPEETNDNESTEDSQKEDFLGFGRKKRNENPDEKPNEEPEKSEDKEFEDVDGKWKLESENINNNVLPKAEIEMKQYIKNRGLDQYMSEGKMDAKITDNTTALPPKEMKETYGEGWHKGIAGFNDGEKSYVDARFGAEAAKETGIHENYHQMSANDVKDENGNTIYKRGVSINGSDRGINEALTQKYTLDTLCNTESGYSGSRCGYNDASMIINDFYRIGNNREMFDQAYFQNNPDLLREHFDSYCGDGFYDKMSKDFDIATDPHSGYREKNEALLRLDESKNQYIDARVYRGEI